MTEACDRAHPVPAPAVSVARGTSVQGPPRCVELGRAIPMGQLMAQDRDQRRLRQALEARRNAGGLAQLRALSVRCDDQRGFEAFIADRDAGEIPRSSDRRSERRSRAPR